MAKKTLLGTQLDENSSSSLVVSYTSARQRSGRCFQRVISGLKKRGQVRLITLTTANVIDNDSFQAHFRVLYMRLLRRGLFVDYIRCPEYTKTGLRHEHILFRGSYIDQIFLSKLWNSIHGAPVVDIRSAYGSRRLAGYMAKYMSKTPVGRYSYSMNWVWRGFARDWTWLKRKCSDCYETIPFSLSEIISIWDYCLDKNLRPQLLYEKLMEGG